MILIIIVTHIRTKMKFYEYIYYRMYLLFRELNSEMPSFLTIMFMCWWCFFNFVNIYGVLLLFKPELSEFYTNIVSIILISVILFLHFSYFNKRKTKEIYRKFSNQLKHKKVIGTLGVLLYVVLTIWILFVYIVPNIEGILLK